MLIKLIKKSPTTLAVAVENGTNTFVIKSLIWSLASALFIILKLKLEDILFIKCSIWLIPLGKEEYISFILDLIVGTINSHANITIAITIP